MQAQLFHKTHFKVDHFNTGGSNGPEFIAKAVQDWIAADGAESAYITQCIPWENGCIEPFNAWLRAELLDDEIFYLLAEAKIMIES